ncbi:MAG: hypothetical protein M1814_002677 [Vezdaea aestivalis]|nr:MAG: hypothetical protein M1814_002677 [Vezdaea aestivalis]
MAWADGSVPGTPRVISPSPTPSESRDSGDTYFPPTTRSAARATRPVVVSPSIDEGEESGSSDELQRARTRSRSPLQAGRQRRISGLTPLHGRLSKGPEPVTPKSSIINGFLSPSSAGSSHFRYLIHKYEVPRKVFHSSIGFLALWLMARGFQTTSITPVLFSLLVPCAVVDILRHRYASLNQIYVKSLGALMRETEVDGYNGVIWYLLGTWAALTFFPKDVGVMAVLLLSWCDTAASTFGRLYGRYTIRLRRGKSLAGSLAAFGVGVLTAAAYWGVMVPWTIKTLKDPEELYMFRGTLSLPQEAQSALGLSAAQSQVSGPFALGIVSVFSGIIGALSEVVDIFNWDDNLTIPLLSGAGLWAFFRGFT